EIEAHLIAHPAVSTAAVVAMPDPILGERSCAYLSLREGATITLTVMREFLDARGVAQFKWPERIELVHGLPLTNVGKIKKSELRRDISEKLAAERGTLASGAAAPQGKLKHGRRKRNPPAQPPDRETRAQQSHATLPSDHRED
ncbi:MAG TPA: hypothetical protein VN916_03455, partial [Candidatus Acidoferrum sp.]|nr:hypothetical protein [Candidatus Acidoferrum sp.]